jgi:hypothetical protein
MENKYHNVHVIHKFVAIESCETFNTYLPEKDRKKLEEYTREEKQQNLCINYYSESHPHHTSNLPPYLFLSYYLLPYIDSTYPLTTHEPKFISVTPQRLTIPPH